MDGWNITKLLTSVDGDVAESVRCSADGAIVTGYFDSFAGAGGEPNVCRWHNGVFESIGVPGGAYDYASAYGGSRDGSVIVGQTSSSSGAASSRRAFVWVDGTGFTVLGTLGGTESQAFACSEDGSVVVGWAHTAGGQQHAFRWTEAGGMVDLGTLGGSGSQARACSSDGSIVFGHADDGSFNTLPFKWTSGGGMVALDTPVGTYFASVYACNPAGTIGVGLWEDPNTGNGGMAKWDDGVFSFLGALSGDSWAEANDLTDDGDTVVGWSSTDYNNAERAVIWTASGGLQEFTGLGTAPELTGIAADGKTVAGFGSTDGSRHAYIATLLPPAPFWTDHIGTEEIA